MTGQRSINILFEPIINSLLRDLFDICTEECDRVIGEKYWNDEHSAQENISRFKVGDEKATKSSILIIESKEKVCRHGFNMEKFGGCPLNNYEFKFCNIAELLTITQTILNSNREMD
ncbi:hypothetical protein [Alkaliphilus serpentinus]|uniref:Uncharacterized protein n=1 Tax=Alkaliphilus serpentinus TaxID=1482731 RepID=A0A833HL42_9FIRM|nr:hypothetical protein [Alkaliphilus serpentinus]KAB3524894.1 hypothetical protein F8153_15585 [Alkaliphilus serpentinus]